jgi:hypothetical protein
MTLVEPGYRKTSASHKPVDGVQFYSYSTGILRYAQISEDGKIKTAVNSKYTSYSCEVEGHGYIRGADGKKAKRFRSQEAAQRAGIKLLQEKVKP